MNRDEYYDALAHHGIKGQKWGVRRYQNPDGTLTLKGRAKIEKKINRKQRNLDISSVTNDNKHIRRNLAGNVAVTGVLATISAFTMGPIGSLPVTGLFLGADLATAGVQKIAQKYVSVGQKKLNRYIDDLKKSGANIESFHVSQDVTVNGYYEGSVNSKRYRVK